MKKALLLLLISALSGSIFAQNKVATSDFARRPHFYQNKTILLENVLISMVPLGTSENKSMAPASQTNKNEKTWTLLFLNETPRCNEVKGSKLIYPEIPGLTVPMCFSVIDKLYQRLPQKTAFKADILLAVDVRGISQIKRIRVLK